MTKGTLKLGEVHPSAHNAFSYIKSTFLHPKSLLYRESLASCALSGDRLSEICCETLDRIEKGEPVSDRYVLGLAWALKDMEDGMD